MPSLHAHLHAHSVSPTLFATPWLLTLFSMCGILHPRVVRVVWDLFVVDGWDVVVWVVEAIMSELEPHLRHCDFEAALRVLASPWMFITEHSFDEAVLRRFVAIAQRKPRDK